MPSCNSQGLVFLYFCLEASKCGVLSWWLASEVTLGTGYFLSKFYHRHILIKGWLWTISHFCFFIIQNYAASSSNHILNILSLKNEYGLAVLATDALLAQIKYCLLGLLGSWCSKSDLLWFKINDKISLDHQIHPHRTGSTYNIQNVHSNFNICFYPRMLIVYFKQSDMLSLFITVMKIRINEKFLFSLFNQECFFDVSLPCSQICKGCTTRAVSALLIYVYIAVVLLLLLF